MAGQGTDFVAPDWDTELEPTARIAATPEDGTIRGMFFSAVIAAVKEQGPTLPGAGEYVAFKAYPLREFMQLVVDGARAGWPGETLPRGLRQLGHHVYPSFAATMIGSAIFAVAGRDFGKVANLAGKAYNISLNPGRVTATKVGERHLIVGLRDIWVFPEIFQVGVWEGALQVCRATADIRVRVASPCDVDFDIPWTDAR